MLDMKLENINPNIDILFVMSSDVPQHTHTLNYTAEEALEQLGIGRFQLKMFLLCGLFSVRYSLRFCSCYGYFYVSCRAFI
jgi:hypothetical protein